MNNSDNRSRFLFDDGLLEVSETDGGGVPAGFYKIGFTSRNDPELLPLSMPQQDQIVEPPEGEREIGRDIRLFFDNEDLYQDMDIAYRRGALLYGPPGTGKSYSIIRSVRDAIDNHDAIAFVISNRLRFEELTELRNVLSDRNTIFIIEEISSPNRRGIQSLSDLLSFLDGEYSWDRNYNIATTNYPGELPPNVIDRPGRFDKIIEMDHPSMDERKKFLQSYLGEDEFDYQVLERLEGYSISYIKEMALRSRLYDKDLHAILDQFDQQKQRISEAFNTRKGELGFMDNGHGE